MFLLAVSKAFPISKSTAVVVLLSLNPLRISVVSDAMGSIVFLLGLKPNYWGENLCVFPGTRSVFC